jgi:hypothetical protein
MPERFAGQSILERKKKGKLDACMHWTGSYSAGVAVPEIISSVATVSWIVLYAIKIYLGKSSR